MHRPSMIVVACSILMGVTAPATMAADITVCPEPGSCDHTSIRDAINAANDGDVIRISAGTYTEGHTINTGGKRISLEGATDSNGNPATIVDGENSYQVFRINSGETAQTVISNLVIQNGQGDETHSAGGMSIDFSRPYIRNCKFQLNIGYSPQSSSKFFLGGAVRVTSSSDPAFYRCVFSLNVAGAGSGGAVACLDSSITMEQCRMYANTALISGGAVSLLSDSGGTYTATFTNCTMNSNFTTGIPGTGVAGGAGLVSSSVRVVMDGCTINSNSSALGAAVTLANAGNSSFKDCEISKNNIGAALASGISSSLGTTTLNNTKVCSNRTASDPPRGSGLGCESPQTIGCTVKGGSTDCDCPSQGGDFDGDGDVDVDDYNGLGEELGICTGDLNGDGMVDAADLGLLIVVWGACP